MKDNQDNKGIQPTDAKVYQPATTKETKTETTATDQTSNPSINKGKQQDSQQENKQQQNDPAQVPAKRITDIPETPKREEDPIKSEREISEDERTAPVSADEAAEQERETETEQQGAE